MKRLTSIFALISCALVFSGCAAFSPPPLNKSEMTPNDPALVFKSTGKSLAFGEFSGPKAKGDNIYLVTTFDLRDVLAQSLEKSQLFSTVATEPNPKADYTLTASIMGEPGKGVFTITSSLIVKYEIIRNATGEVVFSKTIFGKHTVSTGQEFVGATRARMSVQGAVKDNVTQLLKDISQLKL
ncbi:MAG TPA: hypothetical protein VKA67_05655 [Verrucomicrobiae bacterium]|nr:hypothetical protein [Verrucomicrobiae bacterium]